MPRHDAAAALDFRTAVHLKTILDVLGPREVPPLLSSFSTTADPDRAADILLEHGFVVLPALLGPREMERMRDAYQTVELAQRAAGERQLRAGEERKDLGKFYSFPMLEGRADPAAYAPLVDPPLLLEVLHRALGRPVCGSAGGGRVLPVADAEAYAPDGYISW